MTALPRLPPMISGVSRFRWIILAALLIASVALGARPFPPGVKKAFMDQPPHANTVTLGGKVFRLAPGAQIRDRRNLIVMPSAVTDPAVVRYLLDGRGEVRRLWILTPEEAEQPDDA